MEFKYKSGCSYKFEIIEDSSLVKVYENNHLIGMVGIGSLFQFAKSEIKKEELKFGNLL